ncbi:ComEA family DNA-binding protein [Thermanaerothrix sp.]|jgi:competence protein ComEA|uniref:ComEA family DNA-binding protein n=1 Tax=Thermanaerothrix sp. TaxID=2972675 RepID=UPI002ADDC7F1|nr:ComEA family DNA-binding protein [Thermanaerothrix sp.]
MKPWQLVLIGVFSGLLSAALVLLISAPPRSETIILTTKTPLPWVVHVSGAVVTPGVYEVPPMSRVRDVIERAGGLLPQANTEAINLAAPLKDGVKIRIPFLDEETTPLPINNSPVPEVYNEASGTDSDRLDINQASIEQLEALPGIGRTRAEAIVEYRQKQGKFDTIEQIQNVPGIGPGIFEQVRELITVTP